MTYQITTSYPDGRVEVRDATPEEVAQREADIAAAEKQQQEEEEAQRQHAQNLANGIDKLVGLGLSLDEAAAVARVFDVAAVRKAAE
jgi:hypothetical protein